MWGDALEAASAGTPPMTPGPSSVAGASQRIATPPTNSTSLFDAEAYIIWDDTYLTVTPPARGRRKRAHGGRHVATPWLPPLRKRVALEKGASGGRECSFASSGADRATARRGVCDSQLRRGVCDSQLRRCVCGSQAISSDAVTRSGTCDALERRPGAVPRGSRKNNIISSRICICNLVRPEISGSTSVFAAHVS